MNEINVYDKYSNKNLPQDLGRGGCAEVDLYSGKIKYKFTDIQFNYGNPALTLTHFYDGNFTAINKERTFKQAVVYTYGKYGNGWKLGIEKRVVKNNNGTLLHFDSQGRITVFTKVSDGAVKRYLRQKPNMQYNHYYICKSNPVGGITENTDGTFTQFDEKDNFIIYSSDGNLIRTVTADNKEMNVVYANGRIVEINDGNGRNISLTYAEKTVNSATAVMLTGIEDSAGRKFKYNYDAKGNLVDICYDFGEYCTEKVVEFLYNADNLLVLARNESGRGFSYEYTDGKVVKITEEIKYDKISARGNVVTSNRYGAITSIEYGNNDKYAITTVTSHTGLNFVYHFKTEDGLYYYEHIGYESEVSDYGKPRNKLNMRMSLNGKRIGLETMKKNLISNGEFESESNAQIPTGWMVEEPTDTSITLIGDGHFDGNALKFSNNGVEYKISQTVIDHNEDELDKIIQSENQNPDSGIYSLMMWVKATIKSRKFTVKLVSKYKDIDNEEVKEIDLPEIYYDLNEWQCLLSNVYVNGVKVEDNVEHVLEKMLLRIEYEGEGDSGEFLIDKITLSKDYVNISQPQSYIVAFDANGVNPVIKSISEINAENSSIKGRVYEEGELLEIKPSQFTEAWLIDAYCNHIVVPEDRLPAEASPDSTYVYTIDWNSSFLVFADNSTYPLTQTEVVYNAITQSEDSDNIVQNELDAKNDVVMQKIWNRSADRTDAMAFKILNEYDNKHRVTKSTDYRNIVTETVYTDNTDETNEAIENLMYPQNYKDIGPVLRTKETKTADGGATEFTEDNSGYIIEHEYAKDTEPELSKDLLYKTVLPNGTSYMYSYDKYGNISRMVCGKDNFEQTYDYEYTMGLQTKVTVNGEDVFEYDYDGYGNNIAISHNGEEIYKAVYKNNSAYSENEEPNYKKVYKYGKIYKTCFDKRNRVEKIYEITETDGQADVESLLVENVYDPVTDECIIMRDYKNSENGEPCDEWEFLNNKNIGYVEKSGNGMPYRATQILDESRITSFSQVFGTENLETVYEYGKDGNDKGYYPDNRITRMKIRSTGNAQSVEEHTLYNVGYGYDKLGRINARHLSYGETDSPKVIFDQNYTYKSAGGKYTTDKISRWNTSLQVSAESGIYHSYNNTYEYDEVGNIVSSNRTENTGTNVRYNTSYEYDKYGQLIRENNESFNKTYLYYYDNYGNIIYKAELPYTTENLDYDVYNNKAQTMYCGEVFGGEYVAESHDDFISIQGVIPTCYEYDEKQRLVLSGDKAIGDYDAFGNPHLYNGKVLQWNGARLKKFGDWEFTYDSRGYRKQKLNGTELTEFLYDAGGNLLQERKPIKGRTCIITYLYEGDEVVGFTVPIITTSTLTLYEVTKQMPFYYIKDVLGNITEIVDSNGAVVVKYYYDAWGNTQTVLNNTYTLAYDESVNYEATDIAEINSFTYRGYYYDKDVSLYYLINRYYDPTTGRFISIDDTKYLDFEVVFGYNRYAYCLNNPIKYADPKGTFIFTALFVFLCIGIANGDVGFELSIGEEVSIPTNSWFTSSETGVGYSKSYSYNPNAKLKFYISLPQEGWKFWECSFGIDYKNSEEYGFNIGLGLSSSIGWHAKNITYELSVDYRGRISGKKYYYLNDSYSYTKDSFNTFETALTLVLAVAIIVVAIVCVGGAVVAVA